MSTEEVLRRPHKTIISKAKRWSAPPGEKGFSPSISTPDEITRDVRGLKLRQRVSIVLGDEILREELEEVVGNVDFNNKTTNLQSVRTYQDFLVPTSGLAAGSAPGFVVTPVSDIRGMDTIKFSKEERLLRCKVASVYRLAQDFGWSCSDDQVFCTARAVEDDYYYFAPPYGMLNGEMTAASFIKVDMEGNTVEPGSTNFGYNKLGNQAHSILYEALKGVNCVICLTSMEVKAVSAMECGLLPISNEAVAVGDVNYYTMCGIDFSKEDKEDISSKCEGIDKVLFLRNMGAICIGKSVEETFHIAYLLSQACNFQIQAMRAGIENLTHIDKELRKKICNAIHEGDDANQNKRKHADVLFEAFMRRLDSKGHKTGYAYSIEVFKKEPQPTPPKTTKARTPATKSSSFHFPHDKDRNPVRRAHTTGRGCNRTKLKWLNEPVKSTEYRKEPNLESPNIEDVIVKDRKPEREDKDVINEETINIQAQVVAESAPPFIVDETPDTTVTTTVVTVTETHKEPNENLDKSADGRDDSKLLSPEGESGKGTKKRKKVKKSKSFKDTLKEKLGIKKKEPKEHDETN